MEGEDRGVKGKEMSMGGFCSPLFGCFLKEKLRKKKDLRGLEE
jgi:hypothetical protein